MDEKTRTTMEIAGTIAAGMVTHVYHSDIQAKDIATNAVRLAKEIVRLVVEG